MSFPDMAKGGESTVPGDRDCTGFYLMAPEMGRRAHQNTYLNVFFDKGGFWYRKSKNRKPAPGGPDLGIENAKNHNRVFLSQGGKLLVENRTLVVAADEEHLRSREMPDETRFLLNYKEVFRPLKNTSFKTSKSCDCFRHDMETIAWKEAP